jgi:dihydrofolate reductase
LARLIYMATMSLDGYVADERGDIGWTAPPDDEELAALNELLRPVGTFLLGRRMYDTLVVWDTLELQGQPAGMSDFAGIWRDADKIVCSRTLTEVRGPRTTVVGEFDRDAVRRLKADSTRDLSIGGSELAGQALAAGLVDECLLFVVPVAIGGGIPAFAAGLDLRFELLEQRRFASGRVLLRYRPLQDPGPR